MFEDFLSIKYPGLNEKELFVKRDEEYHVWVKDYVCLNSLSIYYLYLIIVILIYNDVYFEICIHVTYWNSSNPFPTWV